MPSCAGGESDAPCGDSHPRCGFGSDGYSNSAASWEHQAEATRSLDCLRVMDIGGPVRGCDLDPYILRGNAPADLPRDLKNVAVRRLANRNGARL